MCGFAAIFFKGHPLPDADSLIRKMTTRMAHRGPDADGFYTDPCVALGHRRLSILDTSAAGNQPMWDITGRFGIVYNGEIYNFQDIKRQLSDYPFRSTSDTEVILAGFAQWGTALFPKLNGIFSLVIYDKEKQSVYAVRDRFGIKPLYYYATEEAVYFASEQRPIIHEVLDAPKISFGALSDYLWNGAVSGANRLCEGLQQLDGGQCLLIEKGAQPVITTYHRFFPAPTDWVEDSPAAIKSQIRQLLLAAVERQLVSDVPLGAFLSGGIDSSTIVALMAETGTSTPQTFTIGFSEKAFDESSYAHIVAEKYKTNHTVLSLSPDDFLEELPHALSAMDTPTLDGANTFIVSKMTRKAGVTVALSGLGGDELFAGYATFQRYSQLQSHWWWSVPAGLRQLAGASIRALGQGSRTRRIADLMGQKNYSIDQIYPLFRNIFDKKTIAQFLEQAPGANPIQQYLTNHLGDISQYPLLSQYSIAEMSGYTRHMLLKDTDQMSMASSLEVRVPFFDNDLVDYLLRVPDTVKFPHTSKALLVESMGDRLPPAIVNRPKMGFTLPWADWLKGPLHAFCEGRIASLCDRGLIAPDQLRLIWKHFNAGTHQVLWSHIWMFVVLEEWLRLNIGEGKK